MEIQNEYSKYTNEELKVKENNLKRSQKIAIIVCFLAVGNVLVNVYLKKNSGVFIVFLILGALFFMAKTGSDLKKVQEEIKTREIGKS